MFEISIVGVFFAGVLSFFSPCVLPLVPSYLCYMAGIGIDDFRLENREKKVFIRWALLSSVIAFSLGFTTIFVALGASASTIGKFISYYRDWFTFAAGIIIIIIGLNFLGFFRITFLFCEARFQIHKIPTGLLGAYVIGLAFAFGWTPCIGPILGPIITLAGTKETVGEGVVLLTIYALGLTVPFVLAALFSSSFMRFLGAFRIHLGKVEKIIGIFLIFTGILFLTGSMQDFSFWLLEYYPSLSYIESIRWHDIMIFLGFSR
ncbi:cytochrome c-type biogenesis protein [Bartonella fuyuanensis]|uniref:Cytochrome c-type biogenesis protein n=1 Tax=Bartonella fuyuanensis TaxID=1460968 RepID=A0A840DT61_9HYPH|nr:cytochrome c biogenesis CcdA family protein [Bartonella fuyuanensis]MBB4076150.1 cytochrome c-type biogenesis protein [Bartonella fuyuanensis]